MTTITQRALTLGGLLALGLFGFSSLSGCESGGGGGNTGTAGTTGAAGTGNAQGTAGTGSGQGTSGTSGNTQGTAGTGSTQGAAGTGSAQGTAGTSGGQGSAGTSGGSAGVTGAAGNPFNQQGCTGPCTDFPTAPIIDTGAPADAPAMFVGAPTGAGPCVTEPEDGAMFPNNWLRPRVKFKATTPGTLHEIRVHSDLQANDLVAYTTNESWTMPKPIWLTLAFHVRNQPLTITVRGAPIASASTPASKLPNGAMPTNAIV